MQKNIEVKVREFSKDDAVDCARIIDENAKDMGDLYSADELVSASAYNNYWVATVDGEIAGMIGFCDLKNGIGMMATLCVSKTHQRKGVGKSLVDAVKKYAIENKFRKILMLTHEKNSPMMVLGISQGFVPEGSLKKHFRTGEDVMYFSYFVE